MFEPVGMDCPACNAFSGGQKKGGYGGLQPQPGLASIEEYLPTYGGGVRLEYSQNLVLVQIFLYNYWRGAPNRKDAKFWAKHCGLTHKQNVFVVIGAEDLRSPASFDMVPGFQLVDKSFVLRVDSTGHRPRHDLFRELLPMVPKLLRE